ncbi:MAG TPA: hypothetical protein VFQ68_02335 [Streptosporangiaceae bacterium]|nr:hypothetical protein [Streptosporangiaceae bacterium]
MNPTYTVSYGLAQARIAELHDQARRQSLAHAARSGQAQSGQAQSASKPRTLRVAGHLRLVHRRRATAATG